MVRVLLTTAFLALAGVVAITPMASADDTKPPSEGSCNSLKPIYGAENLFFGQIVGEDYSFGFRDQPRSLNRVRCFTTEAACLAWLRTMAQKRSRVTYWGCERGHFPRRSLPVAPF